MNKLVNLDNSRQLFAIPTDSLIDNTESHFDVFTMMNPEAKAPSDGDFVLYAKAPYRWTRRELTDLLAAGIKHLYVDAAQRSNYDRYLSVSKPPPEIQVDLAPRFRLQQIQNLAAHVMESCVIAGVNPTNLEQLKVTADHLVRCLLEDPRCIRALQGLHDHCLYTYVHSAATGTLSASIANQMGITNPHDLAQYALAGFLHDVGKREVPLPVLNKTGPLTAEEWDLMRQHPAQGVGSLNNYELPKFVIEIVGMHHEKIDGSGYPNSLTQTEIPDHVKIVTVADIFSALTTSRCYHFKRSRFEALMFMRHELAGKIWREAFNALVIGLTIDDDKNT